MENEMNLRFGDIDLDSYSEEIHLENDDPLDALPPAKKSMVFFWLIDTSASMDGKRIETMNQAMKDILPELIGVGGANTDIYVAVLTFSSGFEWVTPEPVLLERFQHWNDLQADGVTDLGIALQELNQKMSRKSFLHAPSLSYAPVVFLITDGCPTDNYKAGLEVIRRNSWFKAGIKIALAIGEGVALDVLEEFTGDREFVVQACNLQQMKVLVKALSVTSSQIGSNSIPVVDGDKELTEKEVLGIKQEQMKEVIKNIRKNLIMDSTESLNEMNIEGGW